MKLKTNRSQTRVGLCHAIILAAITAILAGCGGSTSNSTDATSQTSSDTSTTGVSGTASASTSSGGGPTSTVGQETTGQFPRIAVQAIAGSQYFPPANDAQLAQYGFILLGGNFDQWPQAAGRTRDQLVVSLKSQTHTGRNAVTPVVFQYEDANEMDLSNPWFPDWITAVTTNNWFLYQSGSAGAMAESVWNSSYVLVDQAHVVGSDPATGLYPYGLLANLLYQRYYLGTGSAGSGMASTHLDGYMVDNMSQRDVAASAADWERNGTDPSQTDATATGEVTLGKADYPAQLAILNPNLTAGGNAEFGYDMTPASIGGLGMTSSNLTGKLGMTMDQFIWATAGSSEGGGGVLSLDGFSVAMARYQVDESNTIPGGIVTITGGVIATDYQLVRYSLALTLMRNGWALYAIDPTGNDCVDPGNTATYPVFDEFWGGSLNTAGYLGNAASTTQGAEQSAAWSQGVWRRDFQNGIAMVNPNTNGTQTVALGGTFYHLNGGQAPNINNGAAVTSVTIAAGDGVILLRNAPP